MRGGGAMSKLGKKHLSEVQRLDLLQRAAAGEHPIALAEAFSVQVRQIYKIMERQLPHDAPRRRGAKGVSAEARRAALQRIEDGEAVAAVARDLGVDRGTIFRWKRLS